jgi:hypothetical protein
MPLGGGYNSFAPVKQTKFSIPINGISTKRLGIYGVVKSAGYQSKILHMLFYGRKQSLVNQFIRYCDVY